MDVHVSRDVLVRVFAGRGNQPVADAAASHLFNCRQCRDLAAAVVEELRRDGALVPRRADPRAAVLTLLEEEQHRALEELRARGLWCELRTLSQGEQMERIRSTASLRTLEVFEAALDDATVTAMDDPHLGEVTALTAHALAEVLPNNRYSRALKSDLQGKAMIAVAKCRRLAADWPGSAAALREAKACLQRGTGDSAHEARRLSMAASLASDTGNLEAAQRLLARAAALYRASQDSAGLANVLVQEASTLLAGLRFEDAIERAQEALRVLAPADSRLCMLARSIVTECQVELGRPAEALRNYLATLPSYDQFRGPRDRLRVTYLEARLLDSFGYLRESEKSFREVTSGYIEEGLYKDAFLTILTLFDSLFKRGALNKAAQLCDEAAELLAIPFCHAQMRQVWEELRAQVKARALTASRFLEASSYFVRHWSVPAARLPFGQQPAGPVAELCKAVVLAELEGNAELDRALPAPLQTEQDAVLEPPEVPSGLGGGGYEAAMERYDRQLIAAALAQTGGSQRATYRLLGIARNTLKAKMKRYGLTPAQGWQSEEAGE